MKHWLKTMEGSEIGDGLFECIDCLEAFDYWPSDTEPRSECPGYPLPVTLAVREATTGLPESVIKRMRVALGGVDPEPNNPFHAGLSDLTEALEQHRDGVAGTHQYDVIADAAELVADGKVIPVEDMKQMWYCETHRCGRRLANGSPKPEICPTADVAARRIGANPFDRIKCRIVDAALHLPERGVAE